MKISTKKPFLHISNSSLSYHLLRQNAPGKKTTQVIPATLAAESNKRKAFAKDTPQKNTGNSYTTEN